MQEIRIHGRGGQGAVLAGEILVAALAKEGKSGASFPMFGFERRGAPVATFVRLSDSPVRERTQIYAPDCLVILDPVQVKWPQTFAGVKLEATLVLNSAHSLSERPHESIVSAGVVDATQIAFEEIGRAAVNTCMLGAFAATTGWVSLDAILSALEQYFEKKLLKQNMRCAQRGYQQVKLIEW